MSRVNPKKVNKQFVFVKPFKNTYFILSFLPKLLNYLTKPK